ncbi:hypothetical protein OG453_39550 [Streptomyces sp. NBC_01381]|uniref:hypothetical protein n=1 Tax=Streptomyces sp. NBC_01381 TaxID=2903845 RepID=UPI0022511BA2|nr:hypothetical protein [Streptomyces sp. NBC_01381]MCX4672673.1 hypothetical protein [Streptomyces sp. NBC_01381]
MVLRHGDSHQLLDTIREFGVEWLDKLEETAAVRRRLTAYCRSRLDHFADRFFSSDQAPLYKALLPTAAAMWPFWLCGGQPAEAGHWLGLADAHVEHILAKPGFSSRSQIAALVSVEEHCRGTNRTG